MTKALARFFATLKHAACAVMQIESMVGAGMIRGMAHDLHIVHADVTGSGPYRHVPA
jgi:hypothetical protein